MDIIGRQFWSRGKGSGEQIARLNLVVEVKSAKDWHIILAGNERDRNVASTTRVWSPYFGDGRYTWLREVLLRRQVPEEVVPQLLARFQSRAFPRRVALLKSLFPQAPPAQTVATAFRETNIDKEKDLEASVLWRAMSALRSATDALTGMVRSWHADTFDLTSTYAHSSRDAFESDFDACCDSSLRFVDFFHPVVLLDSHLWLSRETPSPLSVTSCRFFQLDPFGSVDWWCDIVHSSAFETFAKQTTKFYEAFFRRAKARRTTF